MLSRRVFPTVLIVAFTLLVAREAVALINLDMPIAKIFEAVKAVAIGEVTAANPENRVLEVKTVELLKGTPIGPAFRVQIANPAELLKKIAPGQPLVILTGEDFGKPVALVHVADTWLLAEGLPSSTPAWRVIQAHDAKKSFSGTTAELAKVLAGLKK